jgi:hypothetical protein
MAVLTVVAVFTIGVLLGVVLDRRLLHRRSGGSWSGGRRDGGGPFGMMTAAPDTASRNRMRARIMKRITTEMALTPAQAHAVDSIFARRELQLDSLRARVGPQLDSLRDQMRASIDSVLTPEQRIKFAEQRRQMDARRRGGGDAERRRD